MENQEQKPQPKTLQEMGIPKQKVEDLLAYNSEFMGSGPRLTTLDMQKGLTQEKLDSWWKGQKAQLVNQVVHDLRKCELLEGNEFCIEVSYIVSRQLVTMRILGKVPWRKIWSAMLRKARAKAFQDLQARNAVPVHVAAQQATFQADLTQVMAKIKKKAVT